MQSSDILTGNARCVIVEIHDDMAELGPEEVLDRGPRINGIAGSCDETQIVLQFPGDFLLFETRESLEHLQHFVAILHGGHFARDIAVLWGATNFTGI